MQLNPPTPLPAHQGKEENYQGSATYKYNCVAAKQVDYAKQSQWLLEGLRKMDAGESPYEVRGILV